MIHEYNKHKVFFVIFPVVDVDVWSFFLAATGRVRLDMIIKYLVFRTTLRL